MLGSISIGVDQNEKKNFVRRPGIELGSIAWKATMLTFTPPTLRTGVGKVEKSMGGGIGSVSMMFPQAECYDYGDGYILQCKNL